MGDNSHRNRNHSGNNNSNSDVMMGQLVGEA